jgi:subtilisin
LQACPPGTGVRVAIVDSGVAPELLGNHSESLSFRVKSSGLLATVERCPPGDVRQHGTAVASIVRSLAPEAELTSVRVLDDLGRSQARSLKIALEFCIRQGFDVVNVSLGTRQPDVILDLYEIVDQAAMAGVILVCATDNSGTPDYPAACSSLISVDRLQSSDPYALQFRTGHRVAFLARGVQVPVLSPHGSQHFVSGSSYACPHVSAFAARLRSAQQSLQPFEIKTLLHSIALQEPTHDPTDSTAIRT